MTQQILPVPHPVTSYWLSEPHKYANLRSTPDLSSECDIAIIGSGMAGIVTAYHILKTYSSKSDGQGVPKLVILEARQLCSGATARNGGHSKVKTATLAGLPNAQARNELQAYVHGVVDELKTIVDEEGLDCEFELHRSFDVFLSSSEAEAVHSVYEREKKTGEPWTKYVSYVGEKAAEQVTSIKGAKGAFSVPSASFWPYKFVTGLVERLIQRYPDNLNIQTNTPVTSLSSSSSNNGLNIISTPRGTLSAAKLILATNAYTAGLLPFFKSAIVPVKGMASHHTPSSPIHPHLTNTYNIHFAPDGQRPTGVDYLNPRPDGSIVVGGGKWQYAADTPSWYANFDDSRCFSPRVQRHWEAYMQTTFRGWEASQAETDCTWVGIMGATPDGLPWVGRVPGSQTQWLLAGFNGGGMAVIATAARAVAMMVLQGKGFDDVAGEIKMPGGFAITRGRLRAGRSMHDEIAAPKQTAV